MFTIIARKENFALSCLNTETCYFALKIIVIEISLAFILVVLFVIECRQMCLFMRIDSLTIRITMRAK